MLRRIAACLLPLLLLAGSMAAVTLEKLSLEDMIDSSTLIVRGTISKAAALRSGQLVRTEYEVRVSETLKGRTSADGQAGSGLITVSLPGGTADGITQTLAGVPELRSGEEYVLFLWRARSGRLLLVGMSQGLLRVNRNAGRATAGRPPIDGTLLDRRTGMAVRDDGLGMRLPALQEAVSRRVRSGQGGRQ
ncbi:MAG: hypothetical protein U5J83_05700 [Bryobacterales bacterium]|nr:hypothetical protein [Bryobacterales bacterium]